MWRQIFKTITFEGGEFIARHAWAKHVGLRDKAANPTYGLQIPPATVASYSQVATAIGHPSSARAVGLAAGANPVAFLIPCHRIIQQSGKLGGYHWGETRKQAIHAWESARYEQAQS